VTLTVFAKTKTVRLKLAGRQASAETEIISPRAERLVNFEERGGNLVY
jgi:hypothetical protein